MDATAPPPNRRRPTAKQAAASRRDNARKRRLKKRRADEPKQFRRATLRVRDLQAWLRFRYGHVLPDGDDAALEDLGFLVGYSVLCGKDARHQIETWAPWCTTKRSA